MHPALINPVQRMQLSELLRKIYSSMKLEVGLSFITTLEGNRHWWQQKKGWPSSMGAKVDLCLGSRGPGYKNYGVMCGSGHCMSLNLSIFVRVGGRGPSWGRETACYGRLGVTRLGCSSNRLGDLTKPFSLSDLSYLISKNNSNNNEMIVPGLLIGFFFFSAVFCEILIT